MKLYCQIICVFYAAFILFGCTKDNAVKDSYREPTAAEKVTINADNRFGLKIFKAIAAEADEKDKNIFISPLSISMAFGMAMNGATGSTLDEMKSTLELSGLTDQEINETYKGIIGLLTGIDHKVIFQIANSIWYKQGFAVADEFLDVNRKYFNSETAPLDFLNPESVKIINSWVNSHTNGKIQKIIDEIPELMVMYLINAIYFKGNWQNQFDKSKTKSSDFHLLDGSTKQCNMMNIKNKFSYCSNGDMSVLEMKYGNGSYSMTILLPKKSDQIDALIADLSNESLNSIIANLKQTEVIVKIPKFKLEYEKRLNDVLQALGMTLAFDPGKANFSRITGDTNTKGLYISDVKHKTYVDVNEEGTEAAAVTSIGVGFTSLGPQFIANKPFVFIIRENRTGTILFIGKVIDPALGM